MDDEHRLNQGFESDADPSDRRVRNLVFLAIPTGAAAVVLLLLGLPWWILLVVLGAFGLIVVTSS